jgi:hypothetical protein
VYLSSSFPEKPDRTPASLTEFALRDRFYQKFPHSWDFIAKETPDSPWKSISKYRLTEQKLWYKYTDPNQILGVRFGTTTNYGMYDIDVTSPCHPFADEKSLQKLIWELEDWGISNLFDIQSSSSQGIHLYFCLAKPVSSFKLACLMTKAAYDAGLTVKNGQLETFPNTKAYGSQYQGHRLPLQEGSFLLDKDYVPYSNRLEDFLDAAEDSAAANDVELLESRLDEAYEWYKAEKRKNRFSNPTPANKELLEQIEYAQREIQEGFLHKIRLCVENGWDDFHQTNDLLLSIGKLGRLAYGLSGDKLVKYIRETAVSCRGYAEYCRHKHEIRRRAVEVARWSEKKWSPYGTYPKQSVTYRHIKESLSDRTNRNDERKYNAQNRIVQAIEHLEKELGELPRKVGERIALLRTISKKLFGMTISDATLKKPENLPLWHPKHREENLSSQPLSEETPVVREKCPEPEELTEAETEEKQPENDRPVEQPVLHPESPSAEVSSDESTPSPVIRQNDENPKTPKSLPAIDCKKSVYTSPLMKGLMLDFCNTLYEHLGTTKIATVSKPGGKVEFGFIHQKEIVEILELRDSQKNETEIIQNAFFAMVKPKNSNWESGIQIQLSDLKLSSILLE